MRRLLFLPAAALLFCAALLPAQAEEKDAPEDEMKLKSAYQDTDSESLVTFLNTRARGDIDPKKLDELIDALYAEGESRRQKACQQLVAIGAPAVVKLRLVARDHDAPDAAFLANEVLDVLRDEAGDVTGAAVRLLAARRPAGTAEALLAYLPHAENDGVMDEVKAALARVAHVKGKPDPAVLAALEDPHPLRRANAIVALCAGGAAEPREALRKLLRDKSPSVRLRAALAMAHAGDPKAVSTLITLLADLPTAQVGEAEAYLSELAGDQAPKVSPGADDVSRRKARDTWAEWWLASDGANLTVELEKRTLTDERLSQATNLIGKLGDDIFDVRQTAEADLKKMGGMIVPLLRTALKNQDLEIRHRAQKVLAKLEMDKSTPLSPVTARLIALRKPEGAAEAVLAYLPFADDESLVEELQTALNAVAYSGGKASPAVLEALGDKAPIRRAAAAVALCHGPLADHLGEIRKVLKDKEAGVRLRVALALADAREPEAVPALIGLVGELDAERSQAAEEYLFRLAREAPPKDLPEGDENRKKRSEVWDRWWTANKQTVALVGRDTAEIKARHQGYVTLVQPNNGQIVELDRNFKPRLTITGLLNPWDVQWLDNNRVLVTEYNGRRVTERGLKGEIKWEKKLDFYPMQAERLRNGDTFIVGQNKIIQVNRAGREVLKIDRNPQDVRTARRLPRGQIMLVTNRNQYVTMDRVGKVLKTASLPAVYAYQNEILDNGNVLVPLGRNNRLAEYNPDGKEVWSMTGDRPLHAVRLPNRQLLVSSQSPYKIVVADRAGKKLREHVTNAQVFRVRAR